MEFDAKIAAFIKNIKMTKRLKVFNGCDKEVFLKEKPLHCDQLRKLVFTCLLFGLIANSHVAFIKIY